MALIVPHNRDFVKGVNRKNIVNFFVSLVFGKPETLLSAGNVSAGDREADFL